MLRFFLGLLSGAILSFVYVRYDVELPKWMQLHERLKESVALTASLNDLYDLSPRDDVRSRALEVYFQYRAKEAAEMDREYGYPFLKRLHLRKARREAQILSQAWKAFDVALSKPALRTSFELKYGVSDTVSLKQAMLANQLRRHEFLASWLKKEYGDIPKDQLQDKLMELGWKREP